MRIGIEAQRIFRPRKHGMDMVALELIRQLQVLDQENEYVVFVKPDEDRSVLQPSANVEIREVDGGAYPFWEQRALPKAAKAAGVELLHCTSNTAPLNLDIPLALILHDIIYLEKLHLTKGTWYQRLGNLYRRWVVPQVVKQAARISTVSDFERQRILQAFPSVPQERVQTVYNGVGDHFKRTTDTAVLAEIRQKYQLPESFIFFIGNTDPKKNVRGTMQALSQLRILGDLPLPVVMPDYNRAHLKQVLREIGDEALLERIHLCGYIPNHELPHIYSLAQVFLYPSLRESFGIPILEAMACGTPVLTSQTSSMPEVAGDAALLIDPHRPEHLAQGLKRLLDEPALREQLAQQGSQRAQQFSWRQMALQYQRMYHELI